MINAPRRIAVHLPSALSFSLSLSASSKSLPFLFFCLCSSCSLLFCSSPQYSVLSFREPPAPSISQQAILHLAIFCNFPPYPAVSFNFCSRLCLSTLCPPVRKTFLNIYECFLKKKRSWIVLKFWGIWFVSESFMRRSIPLSYLWVKHEAAAEMVFL